MWFKKDQKQKPVETTSKVEAVAESDSAVAESDSVVINPQDSSGQKSPTVQPQPSISLPPAQVLATKPAPEGVETIAGITVDERKPPAKEAVVPLASTVNYVERPVITVPTPGAGPLIIPAVGQVKVRKLRSHPGLFGEFTVRGEKKFEISEELQKRLGLALTPKTIPEEERLETQPAPAPQPPAPQPPLQPVPQAIPRVKPVNLVVPKIQKVTREEIKTTKKLTVTIPTKLKKAGKELEVKKADVIKPKSVPLPPIAVPLQPNLIAGFVKDAAGHLLEDVILIVKNENGAPVRALKTNLLGQFSISTPLPHGKYTIEAEKEGCKFSIIEFEAQGKIIAPIEIGAQS